MKTNIKKIVDKYLDYYPEEDLSKLQLLLEHNKDNESNLFNRKNFEGHITARGFIYSLNDYKLLLLEHKALNKFLQPGGHVENVDNEIIDSARREILEETGLSDLKNISIEDDINIPFDINSHFIPANEKKAEDGHYHHDFRFLFVVDKEEDVKLDSNESNDYKWIYVNGLIDDKTFGLSIKKIIDIVQKKKKIK